MKLEIFTSKFWKNVFGLLKGSKERAEERSVPKRMPQMYSSTSTSRRMEIGPFLAGEPQKIKGEEHPKQKSVETVNEAEAEKAAGSRADKKTGGLTVRSELNLEKSAVFTVSTYKGKSRKVVVKEAGPGGKVAERTIIVGRTAEGTETGVLTTNHFRIYLALIELWERAGKPVNDPVHFTIYKIIKRLDLQDDGRTYASIKRSLYGLRQISVEFIDSFFAPEDGDFRSLKPFTVLSYLDIYERKKVGKQQKTRGYGEFQFDRHILGGLVNNYTHPLRLDVISSFKKHKDLSILIYTYIDRSLAFKDRFEVKLENLFKTLDLSQRHVKYPSDRKRVVDPVLKELQGKELSTGILSRVQILKTTDGRDYKLVCHKKPFPKRIKYEEPLGYLPESTKQEPDSELVSSLVRKGLTEKQATGLISKKKPEIIKAQLDYLSFRLEEYKAQGKEIKEINAPAILYDSIKENWKAPRGYLKAGREKEREAKRFERERITRLEQEERDRQEQERAEIETYKESLDPEVRAKLRERALKEIRSMEGIKEEFITEVLVAVKENEILKAEMWESKGREYRDNDESIDA